MSSYKIQYSSIRDVPLEIELSLPSNKSESLPLVLYFHGGGLFTGNKKDILFPQWLQDASLARGFAFAGVDYPLLCPFTAKDQIAQMKILFSFLASNDFNQKLPDGYAINPHRVAVTGFSGGAYMARITAIHADPKPAAVLSAFGMGGYFLGDIVVCGNKDFPAGIPKEVADKILDDKDVQPTVSTSPSGIDPQYGLNDTTGRWHACLWAIINGVYLDYLTGVPGLSKQLQSLSYEDRTAKVKELRLEDCFPEVYLSTLKDSTQFPPTYLYHGEEDPLIFPRESITTYEALEKVGIKTELAILPRADHGMVDPKAASKVFAPGPGEVAKVEDIVLAPGAEELQAKGFDFIASELVRP